MTGDKMSCIQSVLIDSLSVLIYPTRRSFSSGWEENKDGEGDAEGPCCKRFPNGNLCHPNSVEEVVKSLFIISF